MVKASKIYERLLGALSNPVPFRDFEQCIVACGFVYWRSRGSHRSYKHPQVAEVLTIQPRGKDAQPSAPLSRYYENAQSQAGQLMQPRYHINVFWSDEDGRWIADVPDLRYCSAHGDTPEEAVAEARVAIELWLETALDSGVPVPEARYKAQEPEGRAAA